MPGRDAPEKGGWKCSVWLPMSAPVGLGTRGQAADTEQQGHCHHISSSAAGRSVGDGNSGVMMSVVAR